MAALTTTSWFQKHPSPANRDWGFHWYSRDAESAQAVVDRFSDGGLRHPWAVLWFDGSRLWWVRTFEAKAAAEQRRYTGVVAEFVEGDGSLVELSRCLQPRSPGPWTDGQGDITPRHARPLDATGDLACAGLAALGLAAAGQCAQVQDVPGALPHEVGSFATWLDDLDARLEKGLCWGGAARPASAGERTMAHYLVQLAHGPAPEPFKRECWRLVRDLAATYSAGLTTIFAELAGAARAWDDVDGLRALLTRRPLSAEVVRAADARAPARLFRDDIVDAGRLWNRVLNYWGRGFLADDVAPQLADLLVRRVAVDYLYRLEHPDGPYPQRYLGRLRWEAVLPAARSRAMLALVAKRAPSLGIVQ